MKNGIKIILLLILILIFAAGLYAQEIKWRELRGTHFIVYYRNATGDFLRELINNCEKYYNRIAEDFGFNRFNFWLWDNRAKIYVYDNAEDFRRGTGQPEWAVGVAVPADKVISTFLNQKDFFETVLPHEMGHIIFREFVGFSNPAPPLWLEEGVASYQQKSRISIADMILRDAIDKKIFIGLQKLSGINILDEKDGSLVNLFYMESLGVVDYLIREFGRDKFVLFCQKLRDKKDLDQALWQAYSFKGVPELDAAWQAYLKR